MISDKLKLKIGHLMYVCKRGSSYISMSAGQTETGEACGSPLCFYRHMLSRACFKHSFECNNLTFELYLFSQLHTTCLPSAGLITIAQKGQLIIRITPMAIKWGLLYQIRSNREKCDMGWVHVLDHVLEEWVKEGLKSTIDSIGEQVIAVMYLCPSGQVEHLLLL